MWVAFGQRGSVVRSWSGWCQASGRGRERQREAIGSKQEMERTRGEQCGSELGSMDVVFNCLSTYKVLTIYCSPWGSCTVQYWAEIGYVVLDKPWPLLENSRKVSATLRKHQQHWGHSPTRFLLRSLITSTMSSSRWTELWYRLHNCCKSVIEGNWISASESLCMIPRVWDEMRMEARDTSLRLYKKQ